MVGSQISGIVSGLDTGAIIKQLMQLEAAPQTLLRTKQSSATSLVTALQALNTKVSSLFEAATAASKPASWSAVTATSSAASVSATAGTTATPSSVTFTIGALAASQASLADPPTTYTTAKPTFVVTRGGIETTITAASSSTADIAAAFNASDSGVAASVVNVGTAEAPSYKLQLTSAESGTTNAFTVDVAELDGTRTALPLTEIRAAADASVTLWAGTPAAQTLTSASNTFTGVLTGVDFTISKVETDPVIITVGRNEAALTKLGKDLVTNLNTVLGEITSRTKATTTTAGDGGSIVKGGLFSGDSGIRSLQQNVLSVASLPVGTTSPSSVGIVLGKDGTFTFDAEKFNAALAADPASLQTVVSTLAERVAGVAKSASDPTIGTITSHITSQQGVVKDLGERVAGWDTRLEIRRLALEKTYASLEVALSKMQSQSSWLSAQLEGLSSSPRT